MRRGREKLLRLAALAPIRSWRDHPRNGDTFLGGKTSQGRFEDNEQGDSALCGRASRP